MKFVSKERIKALTRTSGTRHEIDEVFVPILIAQQIFGTQTLDPTWTLKKNALNLLCVISLTLYVLIGTVQFIRDNKDRELFIEATITLVVISIMIKSSNLLVNRSIFQELYATSKSTIFDIIKDICPDRIPKIINTLHKLKPILFAFVLGPTTNYLLSLILYYFQGQQFTLFRAKYTLMPAISPYFEIAVILHLISVILFASIILIPDIYFVFFTIMLCEASDSAVKVLDVRRGAGEDVASYADRLDNVLGKFYSIHVHITRYLNTINDLNKWPVVIPLIGIMLITCFYLDITTEEFNVALTVVLIPGTVEIFAYNIIGDMIKTKMISISTAVYNFDWINMRLKDKKKYCVITCYMNKYFCLRTPTGELSTMSLTSFYKAAYQAFAVLKSMKN